MLTISVHVQFVNTGFKDQQAHIFPCLGLWDPTGRDEVLLAQDAKARCLSLRLPDPKGQPLLSVPHLLVCPCSHVTIFCTSTHFSHNPSPRPHLSSHRASNMPEFTPTQAAILTPICEHDLGRSQLSHHTVPAGASWMKPGTMEPSGETGWSYVLGSQPDETPQL